MLQKIVLPPGVNRDLTQYALEGAGWYNTDKVRFRAGMPEKIGGWVKHISDQLVGVPRSMHVWRSLQGVVLVGIGTEKKVYIIRNDELIDVTPVRATTNPAASDPITTTSGSSVIEINDLGHGAYVGDYVTISGAVDSGGVADIGGIPVSAINAEHVITSVTDNQYFTVDCGTTATSTESDGGAAVVIEYQVEIGLVEDAYAYGWGACAWNTGRWNDVRNCDDLLVSGRIWSLDNWGQDLIMVPWGGSVYVWHADNSHERGEVISQAPSKVQFAKVTDDRHLACFGCNYSAEAEQYAPSNIDPSDLDTLRIEWSDQEDYESWDIGDRLKTAGDYRLTGGSQILSATKADSVMLVWTEESLHLMQAVEPPLVFRFDQVGTSTGIISYNAHATHNGTVFWLSDCAFYTYQGGVAALVSPVEEYMWEGLDFFRRRKICAVLNRRYDEISWYYPDESDSGIENSRYVTFGIKEGVWWIGSLNRSAGVDRGIIQYPILASPDGYLYDHECGESADGSDMTTYLESCDFDLEEGDNLMFIDRFVPDFELVGDLTVTLRTRYFPHSSNVNELIGTVEPTTEYIDARLRGRQASFIVQSVGDADSWRLGACRLDIQPDGRKI